MDDIDMVQQIASLKREVASFPLNAENRSAFKKQFMAKTGKVQTLFRHLSHLALEERKRAGQGLNEVKELAKQRYQQVVTERGTTGSLPDDMTLSPSAPQGGTLHMLSLVEDKVISILEGIGFEPVEGPEIEDEWHNFTALNFPDDHPAREMQDTFFLRKEAEDDVRMALRTQTSSVQVRVMEKQEPPIRMLSVGRVFRKETISARSHCMFHQIEGLYVDKGVSFADLYHVLYYFVHALFGKEVGVRLRPSYFPFTEPSAEVDIACLLCKGRGCRVCKTTGWVEIGGAGLVDPQVFSHCGLCPETYRGYAFGIGIERMAMLLAQIPDVRLFTENDLAFLEQFPAWQL